MPAGGEGVSVWTGRPVSRNATSLVRAKKEVQTSGPQDL